MVETIWYEVTFDLKVGEETWSCIVDEHFEKADADEVAGDIYRRDDVEAVYVAAVVKR